MTRYQVFCYGNRKWTKAMPIHVLPLSTATCAHDNVIHRICKYDCRDPLWTHNSNGYKQREILRWSLVPSEVLEWFRAVVLKLQFRTAKSASPGNLPEVQIIGSHPELLKLWMWGPVSWVLTIPLGNSDTWWCWEAWNTISGTSLLCLSQISIF